MLNSVVNFSTEFFSRFCFSLLISSEDCVTMKISSTLRTYILSFFYCIKYFVFDVGYVKFRYVRSKWRTHGDTVSLCVYFS